MIQSDIYENFSQWLDTLLEENEMPENTAAYCLNLYVESEADSEYSVQLIAASRFDPDDPDWACEEVWSSEEDIFLVSLADEEEKEWSAAQARIKEMTEEYLETGKYRDILLSSEGIGIGFVDGDLELIK